MIVINARDESVGENEARLTEINSTISSLEHKLEVMQLLQTTEGSMSTISVKKAKRTVTKEHPLSEEEDTRSTAQIPKDEASEGKDDAKSVSGSSVAAMVDEEEPPAILADETHMESDNEDELLDEAKEETLDDDLEEESIRKDHEIDHEEAEEPETVVEKEESTEDVHDEQISSSEEVSKQKTEVAGKAQAVKPSSQQGAPSQVVTHNVIIVIPSTFDHLLLICFSLAKVILNYKKS